MLQKVEIEKPGDTTFLVGEQVDRARVRPGQPQGRGRKSLRAAAKAQPVLQGITKASSADPVVHLGGLVPGDHPCPDRGGGVPARSTI